MTTPLKALRLVTGRQSPAHRLIQITRLDINHQQQYIKAEEILQCPNNDVDKKLHHFNGGT